MDTNILSIVPIVLTICLADHTWTQLPYAVLCAAVAFFGFMAATLLENVLVTAGCVVVMAAAYWIIGKYKGVTIENLSLQQIEALEKMEQEATGREQA